MPAAEADEAAAAYCGACRTLRRRCLPGCIFAPYFSSPDFAAVHGVFGASNVSKMLEDIDDSSSSSSPDHQRALAAATLIAEARARARDPTFGRLSYLGILQEVLANARRQVDDARDQIAAEFGARAAAEHVDVVEADPAAWVEARAQVSAALKHAREQDERLRGVRMANEVRWRELHREQQKQKQAEGPVGKTAVAAEAEREKKVYGKEQEETEPPRALVAIGLGQTQTSAAARQQRVDSAVAGRTTPGQGGGNSVLLEAMMQLAGAGEHPQNQHQQQLVAEHGEKEHGITVGGHGHGNGNLDGISSQEILQFQEFLDMAERGRNRKQQQMMMMKHDDVTMEMQRQIPAHTWPQHHQDPEDGTGNVIMSQQFAWAHQQPAQMAASEQDMLLRLQQHLVVVAAAEMQSAGAPRQLDNLAARYSDTELTLGYGFGQPDMMHQHQHQQAVIAEQQGMVLAQHAETEKQQFHMKLGHGGRPDAETEAMMQELAGILYPAGKHGVMETTQQQQQQSPEDAAWLKVQEMLEQIEEASSSSSTPELFAKRLETMARQAEARHAKKQKDRKLETVMRQYVAAERAREQEETMMQHGETQLDNSVNLIGQHGRHRDDEETQAMMQELADFLEHGAITRTQQDAMTMQQQQQQQQQQSSDDAAWVKVQEMLEELEEASSSSSSSPELAKRLEMLARQAEARHAQKEKDRKMEMAMRRFVAAARAREQEELITQQQQDAAAQQQFDGVSLGQGQPYYWHQEPTVQQKQLATVNGEHGSLLHGEHGTMVFLSPGSAKDDAPFVLVDQQQPQPNGDQMDSSLLPPLPPSLGQVSHQQRTDDGGQGLISDLAAYLHYESLSRHRLQQG